MFKKLQSKFLQESLISFPQFLQNLFSKVRKCFRYQLDSVFPKFSCISSNFFILNFPQFFFRILLKISINFIFKFHKFYLKVSKNLAFPIERSHLADFHFQDTSQNVKYVAKIKKNFYAYSARALVQVQSVLLRESI